MCLYFQPPSCSWRCGAPSVSVFSFTSLALSQGEEPTVFAQASNPRLSKNNKKLTKFLLETSSILSESNFVQVRKSRLSENSQNITMLIIRALANT
ncbi:hypothetical protein DEO72_LG1g1652 [Vigna unguiculata]|uniref:Uncharacterized protein n=1 Tax=Vigna unguiculata TaxID=3917 RepID=A0A4D6KNE1_VIGUN|nr:hypothetical protein DEO72_LG1g1652 [Vigna unguiculata]